MNVFCRAITKLYLPATVMSIDFKRKENMGNMLQFKRKTLWNSINVKFTVDFFRRGL